MRIAVLSALIFLATASAAEARTVIQPSKEESRARAKTVASVQILTSTPIKVGADECAYEYEAQMLSVEKGSPPSGNQIRFGVLGGLEPGKRYVIYLRDLKAKSDFVRLMEERASGVEGVRAIAENCPISLPSSFFIRADRVGNE